MSRDRVPDLVSVMKHPKLFAHFFPGGDSWNRWHILAKAIFGRPMVKPEREICHHHTGLWELLKKYLEIFLAVSRRGGKSKFAAALIDYQAFFIDWRPYLSPGETASILVICPDRIQARVIFRYVVELIDSVPQLQAMVQKRYTERLVLNNSVEIIIATASAAIRGRSVICAVIDEFAFLPTDLSANPDKELLNALRPAMATFGEHALLYCSSSPYARKGELWKASEKHWGKEGSDTLIWRATSLEMNPTLSTRMIEKAFELDPVAAAAEWGGEFRRNVESFVSAEAVRAVTVSGRREITPL